MSGKYSKRLITGTMLALLLCCGLINDVLAGPGDFNIDGTFEAALDLPRIYCLLKEDPNGPPLMTASGFVPMMAFLDTGASGILLSRETCDDLGISIDPNGEYADVGVGGIEFFDISQELYVATTDLYDEDPENFSHYHFLTGPWRFQIKQTYVDDWLSEPIDLLGMPVMAGKTVVLNAEGPNLLDYFSAVIKDPNDPTIPPVDFNVPLRFEKYIMPNDPLNVPPLPVLAYNPVIDGITADYNGGSTTGTWLFDTGGTISLMSGQQAAALGLTDANGTPIVEPDFLIPIGGIGEDVNVPGYQIDNLIIPTLNGYNLVFNNARIGVLNIGIIDDETGEFIILDGVFGSNFLTASAMIDEYGWPIDLAEGAFKTIVIDMQKGLLGFDVNDLYPLPNCGDAQHPRPTADITGDCRVNQLDLDVITYNWACDDCAIENSFCEGADLDKDGNVNTIDLAIIRGHWLDTSFLPTCGDVDHPWPSGDFNRDCVIDLADLRILADEWLNSCDWLTWNCRGADLNSTGSVNFADFADFAATYVH